MPVRSFGSPTIRWPDRAEVEAAVRRWARSLGEDRGDVLRVGYGGSYARGDWGVGSDVDLVIVVEASEEPFIRRGAAIDSGNLPVPADVLVYTRDEWKTLVRERRGLAVAPVAWVWDREARIADGT